MIGTTDRPTQTFARALLTSISRRVFARLTIANFRFQSFVLYSEGTIKTGGEAPKQAQDDVFFLPDAPSELGRGEAAALEGGEVGQA